MLSMSFLKGVKPGFSCGLAVVLAAASAQAAITYEDVTRVDQAAIAYYDFNEASGTNAADAVGSNDTTHGSGVTVNQAAAPVPLDFGGFGSTNVSVLYDVSDTNSVSTVPTATGMGTTAGSVSMWINTTPGQADSSGGGLFYGRGGGSGGDGFGGENELHLHLNPSGQLGFFSQGNSNVTTPGDAGVRDGQWHHVAATWSSGGQARVYVDGEEVLSGAFSGGSSYSLSSLVQLGRLGTSGNFGIRQYGGNMDEVALFNSELTASQITDQYHAAVYHYTGDDFVYVSNGNSQIVGEGEVFTNRTDDGSGNGWRIVPAESASAGTFTNARGGAFVQSLPDDLTGGGPNVPPTIEYKVQIDNPGTYRLYLRWDGNGTNPTLAGQSDSIFADIVEIKGAGTNWYELSHGADGDFATVPWDGLGEAEVNTASPADNPIVFTIGTAGVYTVRVSQREDGSALDAWVLQPQAHAAPTSIGPAMSTFRLEVEAEHFTRRGSNGTALAWQIIDADAGDNLVGDGEAVGVSGDPGNKFDGAQNDSYMQVLPDTGVNYASTANNHDGPFLEYSITVPVTGTYQLSVRFDGWDGASDSLYARILEIADGAGGAADWYRFSQGANSDFSVDGYLGTAGLESVSAGGGDVDALWQLIGGQTYTLRFQPREDGVSLDAFRLTLVVPEPTAGMTLIGLASLLAARRRRAATRLCCDQPETPSLKWSR